MLLQQIPTVFKMGTSSDISLRDVGFSSSEKKEKTISLSLVVLDAMKDNNSASYQRGLTFLKHL